MSINSLNDWAALELKAQTAELANVTTPKVPLPTTAQQLAFLTTRCAELQARVHRLEAGVSASMMYLGMGATQRAQEELSRVLIDI